MSDGGGAVATGNVTVTVLPPPTNVVWIKGGSGSWNDPANWNPARLPSVKDTVTIANSASWTIALDGDQACSNLYASMTASGGLTLSGSSQIRQLTLGGGEIDRAAGRTLAFASTVSLLLLSDLTITGAVSVAYGVGINGIVDDGPATHGIELPGGRYLALNGANTFGGGVTVGDGAKLRVGHASALGAAGGVGLLAGIGCTIDHAATGADLSNATVGDGLSYIVAGTYPAGNALTTVRNIEAGGSASIDDAVTVEGAASVFSLPGSSDTTLTVTGGLTLRTGNGPAEWTLAPESASGMRNKTYHAVLSDGAGISDKVTVRCLNGAYTLIRLTQNNQFSGGLRVLSGLVTAPTGLSTPYGTGDIWLQPNSATAKACC